MRRNSSRSTDPLDSELTFHVERWSDDAVHFEDLIAAAANFSDALAAYDSAVARMPGPRILMRQGARVIRDSARGD
jgi:hypothetical protein